MGWVFVRALPFVAVLLAVCPCVQAGTPEKLRSGGQLSEQCWTPHQLGAKPGESRVHINIEAAFRSPPQELPSRSVRQPAVSAFPGQVIRRVELPDNVKRIAITFDLCEQPHEVAGYDGAIVDLLRQNAIKATFFAGGKWLLTHEERAQQLIADPLFEIGNHGWDHRNLRLLKGGELTSEISNPMLAFRHVEQKLANRQCLTRDGQPASVHADRARMTLLRFPFGACNQRALNAVAKTGLTAIQWDVASGDPAKGQSAKGLAASVLRRVRSGSIVVFHANGRGWQTARALPMIVTALWKKGYQFVTVSELLATPGARVIASKDCYDQRPGDLKRYDHLAAILHAYYDRLLARRHRQQTKTALNRTSRANRTSAVHGHGQN